MNFFNNQHKKMIQQIKSKSVAGLSAFAIMLMAFACSLDIEQTDSIIDEGSGGFSGVPDADAAITEILADMARNNEAQNNLYALREVSTDELLVPTRGTDWGDNGIWRTLHAHTWSPSHQYVLNAWNELNQNVFAATEVLDPLSNANATQAAEAKFIRAYNLFFLIDLYGQVPFRQPDEGADVDPQVLSRVEAYNLALTDIREAIPDLPVVGPSDGTNRPHQAAGNFLLAKLLLNAHIFNGTGTPSDADLQGVIDAVDAVEAGGFALQEGFFELFEETVDNETVFFLPNSVGNRMWNGLHYSQTAPGNTGGGWNGFSTLAEFYDSFEGPETNGIGDGQEERRGFVPTVAEADTSNIGIGYGFLIGQQVGITEYGEGEVPLTYNNLNDRAGNPLVFTKSIPGLVGNSETTGVRVLKYHPVNGSFTGHSIVFRFADAHLMRAEARLRLGTNIDDEVNELRALRGASPASAVDETFLLAERGRELYIEGWRRNDMIRFGQFTRDWEFKDAGSVGDATKNLYPIPAAALLSNPNLVQNEGY